MDGDICAGGMLDEPFVGERVAANHEFQVGILKDEAHGAIACVDRWNRADRDAVLLVDDCVHAFVIELLDSDFSRLGAEHEVACFGIPIIGFEEVLDRIGGAHVFGLPGRSPDAQWLRATCGPSACPQCGQVTPVVGVQVSQEDFV